ncbi:hypothetical protein CcaverHIS002_0503290 [Cutaneotrichosporon cavernicola]|nr:hypothetical protein CcaverHIS002_0503290 [Cutaneotrichosporon cavernicola]BEJ08303.1 hypothetical protein CcaverHIS641_0503880 [Cutaneotrichosporon cavernicola]
MLVYDPDDPQANRWHPFAEMREERADPETETETDECTQPAPALAAAFPEFATAQEGPDGRPWADVEFARNRTVVFLGDSISRYTTKYFCDMVGERVVELNWQHPWSPLENLKDGTSLNAMERDDANLDPFGWHLLPPGNPINHTAHYCYAPGTDILLVHLHSYGLDEEDFWISKPSAATGRGPSAPELIYVNSGMWDVMRFSHEDLAAEKNITLSVGSNRLAWYRRRVREALPFVANEFPKASVYWSATHYRSRTEWGSRVGASRRRDRKSVRSTSEYWADQADASPHPNFLPGGYLWADMALRDLRSEVQRRRV